MENRIKIISIDELKKALIGYSPENADAFHTESAKLANKLFDQELRKIKNKKVVLMCGGSASGKTEFIEKFFVTEDFDGLVFDSTLSNEDGAEIKIKNIIKSKNIPLVCFILPDDLKRCFDAFNKRDRKIPESRFYETHSGARRVSLKIAKEFQDIEVLVYQNSYDPKDESEDQLSFAVIEYESREEMIDFLEKNQKSEENIKNLIAKNYEN